MIIENYTFLIKAMDFENAGFVSSFIKKKLRYFGATKNDMKRVAIVTYEAEINVVIHSVGGTCEYTLHEDHIDIIFHDLGPGISNIPLAMKAGYSTANKSAVEHGFGAGMGLLNIHNTADDFSIVSDKSGTILNARINFEVPIEDY